MGWLGWVYTCEWRTRGEMRFLSICQTTARDGTHRTIRLAKSDLRALISSLSAIDSIGSLRPPRGEKPIVASAVSPSSSTNPSFENLRPLSRSAHYGLCLLIWVMMTRVAAQATSFPLSPGDIRAGLRPRHAAMMRKGIWIKINCGNFGYARTSSPLISLLFVTNLSYPSGRTHNLSHFDL